MNTQLFGLGCHGDIDFSISTVKSAAYFRFPDNHGRKFHVETQDGWCRSSEFRAGLSELWRGKEGKTVVLSRAVLGMES